MPSYEEIANEIIEVYIAMGRDPGELSAIDEDENYYFLHRANGQVARVWRSDAEALLGSARDKAEGRVRAALADFRDFF